MQLRICGLILSLFCFLFACSAKNIQKNVFSTSTLTMPYYVTIGTKQEYIKYTRNNLKAYRSAILNIKNYHPKYAIKELAGETQIYVERYVNPVLLDPDLQSNVETKLEVAKLHFLIATLYFEVGDYGQAEQYLEFFHERYDKDEHLLDIIIDSADIGYPTLGEGIRQLEEKLFRGWRRLLSKTGRQHTQFNKFSKNSFMNQKT